MMPHSFLILSSSTCSSFKIFSDTTYLCPPYRLNPILPKPTPYRLTARADWQNRSNQRERKEKAPRDPPATESRSKCLFPFQNLDLVAHLELRWPEIPITKERSWKRLILHRIIFFFIEFYWLTDFYLNELSLLKIASFFCIISKNCVASGLELFAIIVLKSLISFRLASTHCSFHLIFSDSSLTLLAFLTVSTKFMSLGSIGRQNWNISIVIPRPRSLFALPRLSASAAHFAGTETHLSGKPGTFVGFNTLKRLLKQLRQLKD